MEPMKKKKAGRELGNAAAAAMLCVGKDGKPIGWETYQWYVRNGKPEGNPPPGHVEIDNETGQRMYPLKEVRAWQAKRPGRGNWGGIGARARHADAERPQSTGRRSPQTPAEKAAEAYRARQELAATTVTSDTLAADTVDADTIQANTVTAGTITGA